MIKIEINFTNGETGNFVVRDMSGKHINGFIEYASPEGKLISINASNVLSIEELPNE